MTRRTPQRCSAAASASRLCVLCPTVHSCTGGGAAMRAARAEKGGAVKV